MKDMIKVVRSPARMAWWVVYGDVTVAVEATKAEAQAVADRLITKYA